MTEIASRELRNDTRRVLARVEAGEAVTITVNGRAVGILQPVRERRRWIGRDQFVGRLMQADAALTSELRELAPDTTDDLSLA
ncbi:MAG: type II toxin-antitoxin system prevent-host-death family antitoxin [Actinomycetota bacterium]|nr:type II toxin-antitoxin system prevent-host-death family antitoxin [Actinomycetota bacterium]